MDEYMVLDAICADWLDKIFRPQRVEYCYTVPSLLCDVKDTTKHQRVQEFKKEDGTLISVWVKSSLGYHEMFRVCSNCCSQTITRTYERPMQWITNQGNAMVCRSKLRCMKRKQFRSHVFMLCLVHRILNKFK